MVRHAESPFVFGEERTRGLSAEGELEAKKVAKIMLTEKVDVIVSSPFVRSIQTIEGIAKNRNLEIKLYEELKERMIKGNYKLSPQLKSYLSIRITVYLAEKRRTSTRTGDSDYYPIIN